MQKSINKIVTTMFLGVLISLFSFNFVSAQVINDGTSNDACLDIKTSLLKFRSTDVATNGEVSDVQDFLIEKNLLKGVSTGFYGRATVNAVKAYQRSLGLSATGNVGLLTAGYIKRETCDTSVTTTSPVTTNIQTANYLAQAVNNTITTNLGDTKITSISAYPTYTDSTHTTFKIEVFGQNLNFVDFLEILEKGGNDYIVYSPDFTERSNDKISFSKRVTNNSYFNLSVTGRAKGGLTTNAFNITKDNRTSNTNTNSSNPISLSYKLVNYDSTIDGNASYGLSYEVLGGWSEEVVMDISIKNLCEPYAPSQYYPQGRDCSNYLWNLTQKAGEKYFGVKADPYVPGGSSYRYYGQSADVSIYGSKNSTLNSFLDGVEITLKLVNKNTGQIYWTKKEIQNFKG